MRRGHNLPIKNRFHKVRHTIGSLKVEMACYRTCHPGGGGSFSGKTGDGEAWHKNGDRWGPWSMVRKIKSGQWDGPWTRKRWDIE